MLRVEGRVEVRLGERDLGTLVADGGTLTLAVVDATRLHGLVARRDVRALGNGLAAAGLSLQVTSGTRLLLAAGRGVRPSLVDRLAGLRHAHVERRLAVRSLLGRRW